jgi:TRAP-type C4-dicarboxylate transport system substrate-binding protein
MEKGTIDGMLFNYEGGRAFQIGKAVKTVTELNWIASAFTLVINRAAYDRLAPDLRKIVDDTTGVAAARSVGAAYDVAEKEGRAYILQSGAQIVRPTVEELTVFQSALTETQEATIRELENKGAKARAFYQRVRELVASAAT